MGCIVSKANAEIRDMEYVRGLNEKMRVLREEIRELVCKREKEGKEYKRDILVFAMKEAEWKKERKSLREEMKTLRKLVEEKEERIRKIEKGIFVGEEKEEELEKIIETTILMEQMREERARRDEAVEKWKQLYLAIKIELDDLILRTLRDNGDGVCCREEDKIQELKMELQAKEETVKSMQAQIASLESEKYKRDRDLDILRQSLRIISSKKAAQHVSRPTKNL